MVCYKCKHEMSANISAKRNVPNLLIENVSINNGKLRKSQVWLFLGGLLLDHVYLFRLSNLILLGSTRPCDSFRLNNAFLASGLLTFLYQIEISCHYYEFIIEGRQMIRNTPIKILECLYLDHICKLA